MYYLRTAHTVYTVVETEDPQRMVLNGGKFENIEIFRPTGMIGEGMPFTAVITNAPCNGENRGKTLRTSPIVSIHTVNR